MDGFFMPPMDGNGPPLGMFQGFPGGSVPPGLGSPPGLSSVLGFPGFAGFPGAPPPPGLPGFMGCGGCSVGCGGGCVGGCGGSCGGSCGGGCGAGCVGGCGGGCGGLPGGCAGNFSGKAPGGGAPSRFPQPPAPGLGVPGGGKPASAQSVPRKLTVAEAEAAAKALEATQCHLHKKPNNKCKFCQRHKDAATKDREEKASIQKEVSGRLMSRGEVVRDGALEFDKTYGLSPILHQHITASAHYKELSSFETFQQIVDEMYQYADSIEPYAQNSNTTPSPLFCCLYRAFALGLDGAQLVALMDDFTNSYVRCLGLLIARLGLPPAQLWSWLGEYTLDDAELVASKRAEGPTTTIGEFVEQLLVQDKYYSIVLPRLPATVKRQLQEKLAPISQYRKRAKANRDVLDIYRREGVPVEAILNGVWVRGSTVDLIENMPSRLKLVVKTEDDIEEVVHLGKIILTDRSLRSKHKSTRGRSRSRSRGRDGTDWSFEKGRSDLELIDDMRSRDREKAVCSSGKEYARKPLGYKAACALPSEMGAASARLIEEDTFVAQTSRDSRRRRSPSPNAQRKAPSAEYQAQQQRIFEKYALAKSSEAGSSRTDFEQPDLMRLG